MKYLTIVFVGVVVAIAGCNQSRDSRITGLTIDPAIKEEAEKHFRSIDAFDTLKHTLLIYNNDVAFESFENDSLIASSEGRFVPQPFNSSYGWRGDTLTISGFVGMFAGGTGFAIEVSNHKAAVYNLLIADDFPTYRYEENTELLYQLHVKCKEAKAVISELPEKGKDKIIYGYVEFNGGDYYWEGMDENQVTSKKKQRSSMKMYFKSTRLNL